MPINLKDPKQQQAISDVAESYKEAEDKSLFEIAAKKLKKKGSDLKKLLKDIANDASKDYYQESVNKVYGTDKE